MPDNLNNSLNTQEYNIFKENYNTEFSKTLNITITYAFLILNADVLYMLLFYGQCFYFNVV